MTTKSLDFNKLTDQQLFELYELEVGFDDAEQQDIYARLLETAMDIIGKKRRGKTLSAVTIGYNLRERFGRHVVCVGSKMGLKREVFGEFQVMSEADFRDELERINIAANAEEDAEQVVKAFAKYGISILYSTVVFDEAYKLFEGRRSADKLVQLAGYFMSQQSHYHVTTIFCAPDEDMIDKRIIRQVDWHGRCFHNKYTDICRTRFVQGLEVLTLEIDGRDNTHHPAYYDMYNSWTLLGYRQASLEVNKL